MCIIKYVTCLWDYALYDVCPKKVPSQKGCVDAQPTRLAYDTVDVLVSLAMEHWMLIGYPQLWDAAISHLWVSSTTYILCPKTWANACTRDGDRLALGRPNATPLLGSYNGRFRVCPEPCCETSSSKMGFVEIYSGPSCDPTRISMAMRQGLWDNPDSGRHHWNEKEVGLAQGWQTCLEPDNIYRVAKGMEVWCTGSPNQLHILFGVRHALLEAATNRAVERWSELRPSRLEPKGSHS